jgi:predicted membrane protein
MGCCERSEVTPRLVVGGFIILIGVLFMLENLDLLDVGNVLRFWPAVFIAIGIARFMHARSKADSVGGVIWIVVGTLLLLASIGMLRVNVWQLIWPLGLVSLGGYIVWQAVGGGARMAAADGSAEDRVSGLAIMGGVVRQCNAQDFRGGDLTAVMGGCEVDLRRASIESGEAVIEAFALWGGIDIRVPEDWTVVGKVVPVMGAFEDKTRPPADGGKKRLIVRGAVLMGGVEVKN